MGTWVGSPYNVLGSLASLWDLAESLKEKVQANAKTLLNCGPPELQSLESFCRHFPCLAEEATFKASQAEENRPFRLFLPRSSQPQVLKIDVPGLAALGCDVAKYQPPGRFYVSHRTPASSMACAG